MTREKVEKTETGIVDKLVGINRVAKVVKGEELFLLSTCCCW